jgi:hypothetical protein
MDRWMVEARPPHQYFYRRVIQRGFGLNLSLLPKHGGSIEEKVMSG